MKYRVREQNELKPSGVEWLGDIPKDWIKTNLVNFLKSSIVDGPHETPEYQDNGIPFISVDSLDENEFVNLDVVRKFISEEQYLNYNNKTKLAKNDLLFTKSATIGKVAIMDDRKFMTWSPIAIIKSHPQKIFFKYLFYILKSNRYIEYIKSLSSFNTQLNIGMRVLEKSQISAPKYLIEQQKIANFLDEKSKIFDEAIFKKEQLISKLELAKQSLISEVLTGKLKVVEQNSKLQTIKREENELKPSGVEWLGDIPKDWQVKKLKYLVNNLNNRRIPIESSIRGNMKNSIYDYYGATGIIDKVDNYIFDEPTIVLAEDGANLIFRNIKLVYLADGKYWVNNHAHILSTKDNSSRIYLYHLLEIYDYLPIISGSAQPKLTKESLMNISLPYPSLEEQQKISKYLDEKLIHFDNTIEKTKQSITKLKEAKEALISQVVTGKIEVL